MLKITLLCPIALALCFCGCSPAVQKEKTPPPSPETSAETENPLISLQKGSYERVGLKQFWREFLDPDDQIHKFFIVHNRIYLETWDYKLYAYDFRTGVRQWAHDMGNSLNYGVVFDSDRKDRLYLLVENFLIARDYDSGILKSKKEFPFAVSSEPQVDKLHFYVASWDMKMYALAKDTMLEEWHFETGGLVKNRPYVKGDFIYFGSNDHYIYSLRSYTGKEFWKFKTGGPVTAAVVGLEDYIYVGSCDYKMYCLYRMNQGREDRQVKWEFPTGSPITQAASLIGKNLYVKTDGKGIFALDRDDGSLKWRLPDGQQFLMLGQKRAYVLNDRNEVQVLDNETGRKLFRIDTCDYDHFVTNETSATLFMVKDGSHILALNELALER